MDKKINIAIAGGPCTGKSTLATMLFAKLKMMGYDYDLITEEFRKLKGEMGNCRSPFERIYMWLQQEREELRSTAESGFISDYPLFQLYVAARKYIQESRDYMAVRELFRMCLERLEDRYHLIVLAKDPMEIQYKKDQVRSSEEVGARKTHSLIKSFAEHFWPEKILFVEGGVEERVNQVINKLESMKEEV